MTGAACMSAKSPPRRHARFTLRFKATELDARAIVRAVGDRLRAAGLGPVRAGEVEIALAEAINNVVEHAYATTEPGPVRIACSLVDDRLDIRISDAGRPLPDERLPAGRPADLDVPLQDLPEGGFGWFLIKSLTTDVRYDRCGLSNQLSLRFRV